MSKVVKKQADWTTVAFGDVVRLSKERSSDPASDGFERFVGLEHIEPDDLRIRRWGDIAAGTTFTGVFRPGQVLFGKRRAYQRKVALADFSGVCSGDIYVLEPIGEHLMPDLLPFICQTDGFLANAVGTSAGSLSPRTNWTSLASFEFALPPIEEQRRIAGTLKALCATFESQRQMDLAAEKVRRSILLNAFRPNRSSRDVYPANWTIAKAWEVGSVQLGQQRHPKFAKGPNMRPYLRVANVFDGWIDYDDLERMHFPEAELPKFELMPNDILLNEGQSTELVGRSAIYRGEIPGCCFQKTLLRFRCGPSILPEYAHAYFQHCLYSGQFSRAVVQTTSMAHLTAVRFKEFTIPIPPMQEQRRLCEKLFAMNAGAATIHKRSIAAKAFARSVTRKILRA